MRIVVTAGGTEVPIDGVRVLTNRSKGTFLYEIACAFIAQGEDVTVIGSEALRERIGDGLPPQMRFVPFRTYDDLCRELDSAIDSDPPDMIIMGAAVSDYGPREATSGKIPSSVRTLTIRLHRLPKILDGLRERCGAKKTFIVGFKLTAGASEDDMVAAARAQMKRARLNLVVANDTTRMGNGQHPVVLVTPEGGAIPIFGLRRDVAAELASFVLRRAHTTWCTSVWTATGGRSRNRSKAYHRAAAALELAQTLRLLSGDPGNVSCREGDWLWITPRGAAHKESLAAHRLISAQVLSDEREVRYRGRHADKPSIDAPVHAAMYRAYPDVDTLFHSHGAWLIPQGVTEFPYPCGSREEAGEIVHALQTMAGGLSLDRFGIDLIHHGALIGVEKNGLARLTYEWAAASSAYEQHLREINEESAAPELVSRPIFSGASIVGVAAMERSERWTSFFLIESARKLGLGRRLVELIDQRRQTVGVHERCRVADFYLDRGFRIREDRGGLLIPDPPSSRDDVRNTATCCIYCSETKQVLLMRRNADAPVWPGYWTNPGGHVEPGETLEQTATREAFEEIGIEISAFPTTQTSTPLTVGWDRGRYAFRATCFLKTVPEPLIPTIDPKEVAEARWFTLDEVRALPLAWATRAVLHEFFPT